MVLRISTNLSTTGMLLAQVIQSFEKQVAFNAASFHDIWKFM